jgi:ABC transporter substrate binding protein
MLRLRSAQVLDCGTEKMVTRAKHVLSPSATLRLNSGEGTQRPPRFGELKSKIVRRAMKDIFRLIGIIVAVTACCAIADAQQPKKVPRIGYLSPLDSASESTRAEVIRLALRELGYIEGQNIAIEYRYAEGKRDRLPELAAELVRLKVDLIVAAGGTTTQAAKNATKTIPIIMLGGGADPVEAGFVESLARPGGNVTGLTNLGLKLGGKRLELPQRSRSQSCPCRGSL